MQSAGHDARELTLGVPRRPRGQTYNCGSQARRRGGSREAPKRATCLLVPASRQRPLFAGLKNSTNSNPQSNRTHPLQPPPGLRRWWAAPPPSQPRRRLSPRCLGGGGGSTAEQNRHVTEPSERAGLMRRSNSVWDLEIWLTLQQQRRIHNTWVRFNSFWAEFGILG